MLGDLLKRTAFWYSVPHILDMNMHDRCLLSRKAFRLFFLLPNIEALKRRLKKVVNGLSAPFQSFISTNVITKTWVRSLLFIANAHITLRNALLDILVGSWCQLVLSGFFLNMFHRCLQLTSSVLNWRDLDD